MTGTEDRSLLARLPGPGGRFPRIVSLRSEPPAIRLCLEVSSKLRWFVGHFPEQPVLPGIIQVHWAVIVCRACFGFAGAPAEIKRLKFKRIISPPRTVDLLVARHDELEAQFSFGDANEQNSEGRLVFANAP